MKKKIDNIHHFADEFAFCNVGCYKFLGSKFLRAKEFVQKQMIMEIYPLQMMEGPLNLTKINTRSYAKYKKALFLQCM